MQPGRARYVRSVASEVKIDLVTSMIATESEVKQSPIMKVTITLG